MIKLEDKQNVEAPSATYPYGNIKDNTGSNNGTPLNAMVHADFHQFFANMFAIAEGQGWVTSNGLLENDDNGFQYQQALNIVSRLANKTLMSVLAESIIGNNLAVPVSTSIPYALMGALNSGSAISFGYIYFNGTVYRCNGLSYGVVVNELQFNVTSENVLTITDSATPGLFQYGDLVFVAAYSNATQNPNALITKVVNIGDWDMSTATGVDTVDVLHGVSDFTKIRSVFALIRNDANTRMDPLQTGCISPDQAVFNIDSNSIGLGRTIGNLFDNTSYDATSYNRGWLTIQYVP